MWIRCTQTDRLVVSLLRRTLEIGITPFISNSWSQRHSPGKEEYSQVRVAVKENVMDKQVKPMSRSSTKKEVTTTVRGKPKSGRIWKTDKERFATVKKTIRGKKIKERLAYREEMKQIKELSQSIKEERRKENEGKRLRREENKQRRLENERKSEIVQIIKNTAKLKRMRKKQLRKVEKRDLSNLKVV